MGEACLGERVASPFRLGFTRVHLERCAHLVYHHAGRCGPSRREQENDPESTKPDSLGRTEGIVGICSTLAGEGEGEKDEVCKMGALHLHSPSVSLMHLTQNRYVSFVAVKNNNGLHLKQEVV